MPRRTIDTLIRIFRIRVFVIQIKFTEKCSEKLWLRRPNYRFSCCRRAEFIGTGYRYAGQYILSRAN